MKKELENLSKSELIPLLLASRKELEEQTWRQQVEVKQLELQLQQINTEKEKLAQLSNQQVDLINYLESQIAYFSRLLYGQKRERFEDPNQLKLPFMEDGEQTKVEEEATVEKIKVTYERQKQKEAHPGRHPLPNHLRVEEEIIEPEQDTTDMVKIGEEVSDKLELKPAEFYIRRIIRPKYAKKEQENNGVIIAPLPERAFGKMIAGSSLLASILVDKYVDHLPLYRQLQRFKRNNIPISSNTLDGWVKQVGEFIQILYDHLKKQILLRGY